MHPDEPSSSTGRLLPGHINNQGLALQLPGNRKWALGLQVSSCAFRVYKFKCRFRACVWHELPGAGLGCLVLSGTLSRDPRLSS